MARRSSQDRTRLHPEGSGVAESHRGVVAHVPKTGFGRGGLRRQLRDRSGEEGRYAAAKPESEGMGVGSSSQTTEAPEAHFCVPYLRNGALVHRAVEEFGSIDILVNNAGIMLLSTVGKSLSDQWRAMFEVNVMGLLYATDAAIGHMKEQGSGHLVNISSVAGRKVTRDSSGVYAGTKHAVNAISEGLRQELLEDNIRVSIVGPGAVDTELPDHITDEDAREGLSGLMSLERLQAEDIAGAIVYAVSQPERVSVNELLIRPTQQPV